MEKHMLVVDTETYLIQPGMLAPKMVCVAFASDERMTYSLEHDAGYSEGPHTLLLKAQDALPRLRWLLTQEFCAHNLAFDLAVIARAYPELLPLIFKALSEGRAHDTEIREQLHAIALGRLGFLGGKPTHYSQKDLEIAYLGIDRSKEKDDEDAWRLKYGTLYDVPLADWEFDALHYPLEDAINCLALYHAQKDHQNLHQEAEQVRAAFALHLCAVRGVRTDKASVDKFEAEMIAEYGQTKDLLVNAGILTIDKKGKDHKVMKVIQERVTKAYNGTPPLTPSSKPKCDGDTLAESGDPVLEALAASATSAKMLSTYVPILKLGTSIPITSSPNVLVESGRTSWAKPNLQNQPRGRPGHLNVRDCYIPRPGFRFVSVDYSTLELRTLAQALLWICGESVMAQTLNAGRDLHSTMGASIMGVEYADFAARVKAKDKTAKDFRQMSKAVNFGLPGGLGAAKLVAFARATYDAQLCVLSGEATTCGLEKVTEFNKRPCSPTCVKCIEVAIGLKETWFRTFPEMKGYFDWVSGITKGGSGQIEQFVSKRLRGGLGFCDGANTVFQGLAADLAKKALWDVTVACYQDKSAPLYGSRPWLFAHDEVLCETWEANLTPAAFQIADIMRAAYQQYCPDVDCGPLEPAAMSRWLKEAEMVMVDGKLVCWEPKAAP